MASARYGCPLKTGNPILSLGFTPRSLLRAFQPEFAPIGGYRPRTEQSTLAVDALAKNAFESYAVTAEVHHLTGALVDDSFDSGGYPYGSSTVRQHFLIEEQASIAIVHVQGGEYLLARADSNQFPLPKIELAGRGLLEPSSD